MDKQEERIFEIDINLLETNPHQPRGIIIPESLTELVDSIREQGILEPLVVAKTPAGYQIIAGERRWRAARIVGLKNVPVVIKETSPQGMLEMSIVENIQREDLNPIERAQAYRKLIDDFGITVGEIATKIGKSVPYVSNTLRLLALPDAIKDSLAANVVVEGQVRPLLALGDQKLMIEAFKMLLRRGGTVRMAEELARKLKDQIVKTKLTPALGLLGQELEVLEEDLRKKLEADVRVDQTKNRARFIIVFRGTPEETTQKVKKFSQLLQS
ncbi:ParB/RepB/Spo0J family partition protein [Candidatus Microgenomates bacterium]|nr:ParB/RepB/Spo0J family partition protein [Candidatus Microgenomates bacterium]